MDTLTNEHFPDALARYESDKDLILFTTHAGVMLRLEMITDHVMRQRYSSVWTGDNVATWEHLWVANMQCQRLSISGFSFAGSDIGGFTEHPDTSRNNTWSAHLPPSPMVSSTALPSIATVATRVPTAIFTAISSVLTTPRSR